MKNEYKITREKMMSWAKEYHLQNTASIILFIFWLVAGLYGISTIILLAILGGDWINWYICIFLLLLSMYKLFLARFVTMSNRYKILSKTYGVTEWMRTTEFTNDEIILRDHTSITKFKYNNIKKITQKNNIVMIFFNNNIALRLYKDAFVEGSWEECESKITSMLK